MLPPPKNMYKVDSPSVNNDTLIETVRWIKELLKRGDNYVCLLSNYSIILHDVKKMDL